MEGGGERLIKDLKRKANSLSRGARQARPLGWRGGPHPTRTAPVGMTKTPTLRGSAEERSIIKDFTRRPTRCRVEPASPGPVDLTRCGLCHSLDKTPTLLVPVQCPGATRAGYLMLESKA